MGRYILTFYKKGYIRFISHLDIMRLFERSFKRGGVRLQYSQGFNPHPKIVFAQPLSLGYTGENELVEIETKDHMTPNEVMTRTNDVLPEGIKVISVEELGRETGNKTVASKTEAAEYTIEIPASEISLDVNSYDEFMAQNAIMAEKRRKKSKEIKTIDIKPMIKSFSIEKNEVDNKIILKTKVDQGSDNNLSPELIISAFLRFFSSNCNRSSVEVTRNKLYLR